MKKAYFGGSFDPPHCGHLALARHVLETGAADEVWFAPAFSPPHKRSGNTASYADRCAMTQRLIAGEKGMFLSEIEGELRYNPCYTVDVLDEIRRRLPEGDEVLLLIGGDSLAALDTWKEGNRLVREYRVLSYPRNGSVFPEGKWEEALAQKLRAGMLKGDFFEISSTALRKQLENGGEPGNIIPEEVKKYIRENKLYG